MHVYKVAVVADLQLSIFWWLLSWQLRQQRRSGVFWSVFSNIFNQYCLVFLLRMVRTFLPDIFNNNFVDRLFKSPIDWDAWRRSHSVRLWIVGLPWQVVRRIRDQNELEISVYCLAYLLAVSGCFTWMLNEQLLKGQLFNIYLAQVVW